MRSLGLLLAAAPLCACAPVTTSTKVDGPTIEYRHTEKVAPERGRPRFHARLRNRTLTLDAEQRLVCRQQRTEHESLTVETTTKPEKGVVVTEIVVAGVCFAFLAFRAGTGTLDEPLRSDDTEGVERDKTETYLHLVAAPAIVGAASTLALAIELWKVDYTKETKHQSRRLPDSFAPCSNRAIDGLQVVLRQDDISLASHFDKHAKAHFKVDSSVSQQLSADPDLDVYIDGRHVARITVETSTPRRSLGPDHPDR